MLHIIYGKSTARKCGAIEWAYAETNKDSEVVIMPRARSPNSIEAERMYHEGMLLVEIAKKLNVPSGTVRRWKSTQNWEANGGKSGKTSKKKQSERSEKKKANVRKKQGAPIGNKNAAGHGAPEGNGNALKHGGYSAVYWDTLTEEEKEMIDNAPSDEETLLTEQIRLFAVRERRLMKAIKKYSEVKGGQYVSSVTNFEDRRKFKSPEEEQLYKSAVEKKVRKGERLPGEHQSIQTNTGATVDLITRLERELTSVQGKKTKAIEALLKARTERLRLEKGDAGSGTVDDWISAVIGDGGDMDE